MSAQTVFDELKPIVSSCEILRDHLTAVRAAEARGFISHPTPELSQIYDDLRYADENGGTARLYVKWHDPSGPFQNLPDITRIRLILSIPGKPLEEYLVEYPD